MPGGMANTAGGTPADFTLADAVKTIKLEEYKDFTKKPCVRDGLLTGIGSGFALGGLTAILRRPVWSVCNYSVGGFVAMSLGGYQYCQYYRTLERTGMKRITEVMEQKKAEIAARREAKRLKEEADRLAEEKRREEERRKTWKYWAEKNLKIW